MAFMIMMTMFEVARRRIEFKMRFQMCKENLSRGLNCSSYNCCRTAHHQFDSMYKMQLNKDEPIILLYRSDFMVWFHASSVTRFSFSIQSQLRRECTQILPELLFLLRKNQFHFIKQMFFNLFLLHNEFSIYDANACTHTRFS